MDEETGVPDVTVTEILLADGWHMVKGWRTSGPTVLLPGATFECSGYTIKALTEEDSRTIGLCGPISSVLTVHYVSGKLGKYMGRGVRR